MRALAVTRFRSSPHSPLRFAGVVKVDASQMSQIGAVFVRATDSSIGQLGVVSKGQINDERINLQLWFDSSGGARAFSNESPGV
jgi:hypothetical protein